MDLGNRYKGSVSFWLNKLDICSKIYQLTFLHEQKQGLLWNWRRFIVSKFGNICYKSPRNKSISFLSFYDVCSVYFSLIFSWLANTDKKALQQLPRDSRRLKCRQMVSLSIKYHRQIHLSDGTPTLLLCCDQWERTSVDNRLKTEPFLLRQWVGTNGSLKERCTTDISTEKT